MLLFTCLFVSVPCPTQHRHQTETTTAQKTNDQCIRPTNPKSPEQPPNVHTMSFIILVPHPLNNPHTPRPPSAYAPPAVHVHAVHYQI